MKTMVSTAGNGLLDAIVLPDVLGPGAKAGPWVVERELGRGGMGAVYAVVHEAIGKRAALKVVHQRLLVPGFNSDRMLLEAKVVNQVGHPNIVDIFETGRLADGRPYIVMERLDGQPLSNRADEGKLLPDLVIAILLQVCDALIAAHAAGIVHRDLKLDNVFLVDNPDDPAMPKVKLLDWGIAKVLSDDVKHTIEGQLVGTPQYLSPEQARGIAVSPQTDVYSLGVMAYELFLEQLPFEAETAAEVMAMHLRLAPPRPSELWPDIPQLLESLLLAMLAKQADQRPTMLEVARRLEAVRVEFDRRRGRDGREASPSASVAGRIAWKSERSIAADQPSTAASAAWQAGKRSWQYAAGMIALAVAALLFLISRDGDRAADAATVPAGSQRDVRAEATSLDSLAATAEAPDSLGAPGANAVLAVDGVTPSATQVASPVSTPALRTVRGASPVTGHAATRAPGRASSAKLSVPVRAKPARLGATSQRGAQAARPAAAAHRGTKVDPDGTLEPYR